MEPKTFLDWVLEIIGKNELGDPVRWILENNSSQALPYHNFSHSLWVLYHSYFAYEYEGKDVPKEVLFAALFHDFAHTEGFFRIDQDNRNTELAAQGFNRYSWKDGDCKELDGGLVIGLIRSLEFPHQEIRSEPGFMFMVNALRDADLLSSMNDTQLHNLVAIKEEYFRHLSWDEYVQKSVEFLGSIEFKTKYGLEIGTELQRKAIARLGKFSEIVFGD